MLPWIMWGWNCNMENRCRTSFSGNLYQINYCEGGTSNRSIVWLGVITNITIDCTTLSSRHWGIFMWTQILTVLLLPSFWHLYFHLNIKQQSSLWFWSTLAIILGSPLPRPGGAHIQMEPAPSWKLEEDKEEKFSF